MGKIKGNESIEGKQRTGGLRYVRWGVSPIWQGAAVWEDKETVNAAEQVHE